MVRTVKNYCQVGDVFFIIEVDSSGKPFLREANTDEVINWEFEKIALRDSDDQVDESIFQDIIDKTQKEMEDSLTRSLKQLILNGLGITSDSSGKFHINGFNSEKSVVGKHIEEKMMNRLKEADLNKEFDLTDLEKKNLRAEMKKKFKDSYENYVSQIVWNSARELAAKHVKEEMDNLAGDKLKAVAKGMVERALNKRGY